MKVIWCVLTAGWFLAAFTFSSSQQQRNPSVKNFGLLAEDVNIYPSTSPCSPPLDQTLGKFETITIDRCSVYPCHAKNGETRTIRVSGTCGADHGGFHGLAWATIAGSQQNVFNATSPTTCISGSNVTVPFTFTISLLAAPGCYPIHAEMYGFNADNTSQEKLILCREGEACIDFL